MEGIIFYTFEQYLSDQICLFSNWILVSRHYLQEGNLYNTLNVDKISGFKYEDDIMSHWENRKNIQIDFNKYNTRAFGFSASRQSLYFANKAGDPYKESREIILNEKRLNKLAQLDLNNSEKRIAYFRKELEKKRISFLEDSITLVISRDNIIEDSINQILSTDGFSLHKEIKIFFVGEEAQDAGGVFKEWIFSLLQHIFTGQILEKKEVLRKEPTWEMFKASNHPRNKNVKENVKFHRNFEENNKIISDVDSMASQEDIGNGRLKEFNNKEESKGKLSSIEEKVSYEDNDGSCNKLPYMNGVKVNDNFDSSSDVEYFYEFGKLPDKLANLLGKVIGKAIFEGVPISPRLNHFLIKWILGQDFELNDIKTYDQGIFSSIGYIMNNDFKAEDLGMTFSFIDPNKYSDELIVNNNNKSVFLEMLLNYYGYKKSASQIDEFLNGLYSVVPMHLLNILTVEDLEKMLIGTKKIDIVDWKMHTKYKNDLQWNKHIKRWFWELISTLDDSQLRKFLQFWTGCQSVPIDGFANLKNNRQEPSPFTIKLVDIKNGMIRAHTWFNRIELPRFKDKSEMEASIKYILDQKQFVFDFE